MTSNSSNAKRVTLALEAPEAQQVYLAGSFNDWEPTAARMSLSQDGRWTATLALAPGEYQYRFVVDGEWCDDPECDERCANAFGGENCVLRV